MARAHGRLVGAWPARGSARGCPWLPRGALGPSASLLVRRRSRRRRWTPRPSAGRRRRWRARRGPTAPSANAARAFREREGMGDLPGGPHPRGAVLGQSRAGSAGPGSVPRKGSVKPGPATSARHGDRAASHRVGPRPGVRSATRLPRGFNTPSAGSSHRQLRVRTPVVRDLHEAPHGRPSSQTTG